MNRLCAVALLGALSGCVHYFPGTNIPDTADTRAIRDVFSRYRTAVEAKDVAAIVSLCSESYRDDGGTIHTDDDLDYAALREVLPKRMAKLGDTSLYLELKDITVEQDRAVATYSYVYRYKLPSLSDRQASDSDLMQMTFARLDKQWKITRGL